MKYHIVPNTELKVSQVCYGSLAFLDPDDTEDAFRCLDYFISRGGNFLDSANIYGKWLPHGINTHEQLLGKWMSQRKNRSDIILSTKAAHPLWTDEQKKPRMKPKDVMEDLEESLAALQTDYIDIFWLHMDDPATPVPEIIDMMNGLVKAGKIRYYGCSNWTAPRIKQAMEIEGPTFIANQMYWNIALSLAPSDEDETNIAMNSMTCEIHKKYGLTAMPYASQANGYFTKLANGTAGESMKKRYDNEYTHKVYSSLIEKQKETGKSITALVLEYFNEQPFLTIPIIGCRSVEQLEDSLSG